MQPGGAEGAAGVWAGGCSSVRFGWGLGTSLEPLWCPCYDPFFLFYQFMATHPCPPTLTHMCSVRGPMGCSPPSSSVDFSRQEYWSGLPFPLHSVRIKS